MKRFENSCWRPVGESARERVRGEYAGLRRRDAQLTRKLVPTHVILLEALKSSPIIGAAVETEVESRKERNRASWSPRKTTKRADPLNRDD